MEVTQLDMLTALAGTSAPKQKSARDPLTLAEWEEQCRRGDTSRPNGVEFFDIYTGARKIVFPSESIIFGYGGRGPDFFSTPGHNRNSYLPWERQIELCEYQAIPRRRAVENGTAIPFDHEWLAICNQKIARARDGIARGEPVPAPPFMYIYEKLRRELCK